MRSKTYGKLSKTIIIILVIVVAIGFIATIGNNTVGDATGTIEIVSENADMRMYIDEKEQETSRTHTVRNGYHSVLLARPGYFPWRKVVTVEEEANAKLYPFFIPQMPHGVIIPQNDTEYSSILSKINATRIPDAYSKKVSYDDTVAIWLDVDSIMIEWRDTKDMPAWFCGTFSCAPTRIVHTVGDNDPITFLNFLRNRSDVIVFGTQHGLYALEVDNRPEQNFQPIYSGNSIKSTDGATTDTYYVLDGTNLLEVSI